MKRIKKTRNKKQLLVLPIVAGVAIVAAISISVVYAYSHNTSVINNGMKLAGSGVTIIEDSDEGFGKKEITFKNQGEGNATVLLRIAYSETWTRNDGSVVSNVNSSNANVVTKTWTSAFTDDFEDGHDGWYYYKKTLPADSEVKVLSSIALNDASYEQYNYDISFRFEAVQADAAAANELWGKTVTVGDNGVATWQL